MVEERKPITSTWAKAFTKLLSDDERGILATELMFVGKEDDKIKIHTILVVGKDKDGTEKVAAIDVATNKPIRGQSLEHGGITWNKDRVTTTNE